MKISRFLATALLALAACTPKEGEVRIIRTSAGKEADLGRIREIDGPVSVRLIARNEYADTLFPVQLYTPCGCTQAQFDKTPVPPGADQTLEITYNPAYRPGPMTEKIVVYYRNSPVKTLAFVIKGEVEGFNHPIEEDRPYAYGEGLYMSHKILHFGQRAPAETGDVFFRYGNGNRRKAKVTFDIPDPWRSYVRMRQPGTMKADQRDTLHVKFTMPEGVDTVDFAVQPRVNGKPTEEVLRIFAVGKQQ